MDNIVDDTSFGKVFNRGVWLDYQIRDFLNLRGYGMSDNLWLDAINIDIQSRDADYNFISKSLGRKYPRIQSVFLMQS